jgi:hypothetical protein
MRGEVPDAGFKTSGRRPGFTTTELMIGVAVAVRAAAAIPLLRCQLRSKSGLARRGSRPEGLSTSPTGGVSSDGAGYTADAGAVINADGFSQFWGDSTPDTGAALAPRTVACDETAVVPRQIRPCHPAHGRSIF